MALNDLEWKCHVCGSQRPDRFISVYKRESGFFTENIRYCNDRPSCIEGAPHVRFLSGEADVRGAALTLAEDIGEPDNIRYFHRAPARRSWLILAAAVLAVFLFFLLIGVI